MASNDVIFVFCQNLPPPVLEFEQMERHENCYMPCSIARSVYNVKINDRE
jgi:hypothetical protein